MECHSFQLSKYCCSFSPNGLYVAFAKYDRLNIYLVSNKILSIVFQCTEIIEVYIFPLRFHLFINYETLTRMSHTLFFQCRLFLSLQYVEWSTDSELVLSAYRSKGNLEVWSVKEPSWRCKISTGPLGLLFARFTPCSRHVLTISNLHVIFDKI